jgi:N-glycosylase/DNA lyase
VIYISIIEADMNKIYEQYRKNITNRERFVRIAERRVNRIMDALEKLGDCSNQRNYHYSNADIKKMFGKIEKKLKETRLKFQGTSKNKKEAT